MSETDYTSAIYARLWALLEAHATFASLVKPGNRIKLDGSAADPFKQSLNDGDLPQVVIGMGDAEDSLWTLTQQYAYSHLTPAAQLSGVSREVMNFTITHVGVDLRIGKANPITHAILTALRKGGPRLGLAYVQTCGPAHYGHRITASQVNEYGDAAGTKRLVVTITVPVAVQFKTEDQLG